MDIQNVFEDRGEFVVPRGTELSFLFEGRPHYLFTLLIDDDLVTMGWQAVKGILPVITKDRVLYWVVLPLRRDGEEYKLTLWDGSGKTVKDFHIEMDKKTHSFQRVRILAQD